MKFPESDTFISIFIYLSIYSFIFHILTEDKNPASRSTRSLEHGLEEQILYSDLIQKPGELSYDPRQYTDTSLSFSAGCIYTLILGEIKNRQTKELNIHVLQFIR